MVVNPASLMKFIEYQYCPLRRVRQIEGARAAPADQRCAVLGRDN
jgi:hypothetical protein